MGFFFTSQRHGHAIFREARGPSPLQMFSPVAGKWFRHLGERKVLNRRAVQTKVPAWLHLIGRLSHPEPRKGTPALRGVTPG